MSPHLEGLLHDTASIHLEAHREHIALKHPSELQTVLKDTMVEEFLEGEGQA